MKSIFLLLPVAALASVDCTWDYASQLVTCPNHKYYDRVTKKLLPITYHTSPFSRPLEGDKTDKLEYYEHDDSRIDNNGTTSFSYFFNVGRNAVHDDTGKMEHCKTTTGSDNKVLTTPAMGYQVAENKQLDFQCHRIGGDVSKLDKDGKPENVVVGPIQDDDPTKGFYMTVKGGDDCDDTWRKGGYSARSLTIRFHCDTSSDAVAKLPDIETMREEVTCMYVLDVYSSHGCPLQCPRVEGFSGGKYGSTCNGPAGQCISGEIPKGEPTSERNVGEPTCVCDGNEGWVGPSCDKKCPRDATGKSSCQNGHCAYDAALDAGRCFCDQYHIGTNCEKSTDGLPAAPAAASTGTSGVEVFGWVLFVFALFGLVGFVVYHKRSMGEWGGSGNGSGGPGYGQL